MRIIPKLRSSFLLVLVLTSYACNKENAVNTQNEYVSQIQFFKQMYSDGFTSISNNIGQSVKKTGNKSVSLYTNFAFKKTIENLNGKYFTIDNSSIKTIAESNYKVNRPDIGSFTLEGRAAKFDLSQLNHYTPEQLQIFQPFIDNLFTLESFEEAKESANDFQNELIGNRSLSKDEKIELIGIAQGIIEYANFIQNGGISIIESALSVELSKHVNGRVTAGCSVDTRGVLAAGVLGLVGGAIKGAVTGCTGGIVAGPIGVASGCVGGAVMGGASGFIVSIGFGIAEQLLISCFRYDVNYRESVKGPMDTE